MAYTPLAFATTNVEGVDVNAVYTVATATSTAWDPAYPNQPFLAGTRVASGYNNSEWVFATSVTGTSKGNVVTLSTAYGASPLSNAAAATAFGYQIGVAMATATTGQGFWVQTRGQNQFVSCVASSTANVPLYTSATAGALASVIATGTNYTVLGIIFTTTASSTSSSTTANLTSIELGQVSLLANYAF